MSKLLDTLFKLKIWNESNYHQCYLLYPIKYFTRKGSKSGNLLPVSLPKCKFYFPIRTQSELDQLEVYRVYQHQGKNTFILPSPTAPSMELAPYKIDIFLVSFGRTL